jgi:hypothetical protein
MGLSIHYILSKGHPLNLPAVGEIVKKLRDEAVRLGFAEVGELTAAGPQYEWLYYWPRGAKKRSDLAPAHDGWFFSATPGEGCESMRVGLCRFAGAAGWRLEAFCKTQYASRHGWKHFLKCHRCVIKMLRAAQKLGLRVKAEDEGGLWETNSAAVLRRNLKEYDECIAAFGGALKDAAAAAGQTMVGPIFDHPQFEHLEARGLAEHGGKVGRAVEVVKQLVR